METGSVFYCFPFPWSRQGHLSDRPAPATKWATFFLVKVRGVR
jgi:hypothetical protein